MQAGLDEAVVHAFALGAAMGLLSWAVRLSDSTLLQVSDQDSKQFIASI